MNSVRALLFIVTGVVVALTSGCSTNKALKATEAPKPVGRPTLAAGDDIEFRFFYAPELNTSQRIRPDGTVSLSLVGEISAAGLTASQLDAKLEEQYAKHLRFPEVAVIVRGSHQQRVLVAGEVKNPGAIDMPSNMSVFEAVILAGGLDMTTGNPGKVIVLREDAASGKRQGYAVNLNKEMGGGASDPFMLQAMDIVYVPRTGIVNVNQFIDQYISGILPTGLVYSRQVGDGSVSVGKISN